MQSICNLCESRFGEWTCTCIYPLRTYCSACFSSHQNSGSVHAKLPAFVRSRFQRAEDIEPLLSRQLYIGRLVQSLQDNLRSVQEFSRQVASSFQRLMDELSRQREESLRRIAEQEAQLQLTLACVGARIEMVRYEKLCEASCYLDELVLTGWRHGPSALSLDLLRTEFSVSPPSLTLTVEVRNPFQPCCLVPTAKSNRFFLTDVSDGNQREVTLPANEIDGGTSFCFTQPRTVFCCGGMKALTASAKTYELQLDSCTLRELAPMKKPRGFTGLVHRDFHVYAFGGGDGRTLRCCEKYSCSEGRWTPLAKMRHPRSAFTPVVLRGRAWLVGSHAKGVVECFHFEAQNFETLSVVCPCTRAVTAVGWRDDLLVLGSQILALRVTDQSPVFAHFASADFAQGWSNLHPLSHDSTFFFLQSNGQAPVALLSLSLPTVSVSKLATF